MSFRWRSLALVVALALVGACGGATSSSDKAAPTDEVVSTTTTSGDASTSTSTSAPATTQPPSSANTARGGGHSATTRSPSSPTGEAAPDPATSGTYTYAQSGSTPDGPVPPSGTLDVSGGATQSFRRYYDPAKAPQTLTFQFRDDGPFVTSATLSAKGITVTCSFASPVPLPPWPPVAGKTFSGSATCSNGIVATMNGSITSRNGDVVGLAATIHASGSGVNVTMQDDESWSISLRVPKSSHQTFSGTSPLGPISGDVTSRLVSTP